MQLLLLPVAITLLCLLSVGLAAPGVKGTEQYPDVDDMDGQQLPEELVKAGIKLTSKAAADALLAHPVLAGASPSRQICIVLACGSERCLVACKEA